MFQRCCRLGIPGERCLLKPLAQGEGLEADLPLAPTFPGALPLKENLDIAVTLLERFKGNEFTA